MMVCIFCCIFLSSSCTFLYVSTQDSVIDSYSGYIGLALITCDNHVHVLQQSLELGIKLFNLPG